MSVQLNPYKKYIIVTLQITRFQKVNIKDDKQQQILYFSSCYQLHWQFVLSTLSDLRVLGQNPEQMLD